MLRMSMSVSKNIEKPNKIQRPTLWLPPEWGTTCKKTSPKSPPAARACPSDRLLELCPSPAANLGKSNNKTLGARLIKAVDEKAATIAFWDTIFWFL